MKKLLPAVFSGILASVLICICSQANAGEKVAYQNWIVDMSGVTTEEQLMSEENTIHPDFYMDELPALLEVVESSNAPVRAAWSWGVGFVRTMKMKLFHVLCR